ncbi:hypothetical protein FHT44_006256 [Mycolicibacterium sp. BK634]|nr:hypothetical protein [Mycolicibacterium sp. BK634]
MTYTLTRMLSWVAEQVDRRIGWSKLPTALGIPVLVGLRARLRANNLTDSGRGCGCGCGCGEQLAGNDDEIANHRTARTLSGAYNNLDDPLMGAVGCRFGRNVPLTHAYREDPDQLLRPSPRLISRALLTRSEFQPATTLNLLAAAWIQFEVHDWLSHDTSASNSWTIPLEPGDSWPQDPMRIKRTAPDPNVSGWGPPTYVTQDSHWWDGSQIYGTEPVFAKALRTQSGGRLRIDDAGLPPTDVEAYVDLTGTAGNFWVGLAILHSLFMREHNAICDRLAAVYPQLSDQQLYDAARLVNAALMAKIHTLDWTPAIIAHPTTVFAMRANWFGVLGEKFARRFGRLTDNEVLQGIPGSPTNFHGVPYSLTEEFVAVYRMHPLIPDEFVFRSVADDSELARHELPDLAVLEVRDRLSELDMADIFYSFGRAHPGAITLHNYPRHLQELHRPDGELLDLAAVDILRTRERAVPRYNEFRRLLHLKPVASFGELTDNPDWARELEEIYGDVESVDLMIGMYAEPKPPGFGFSDTAFRIFILMASRRLESDRFFTADFTPEIYTEVGFDWVKNNDMRSVLLRHFPSLRPALVGVSNPFAPWTATTTETRSR